MTRGLKYLPVNIMHPCLRVDEIIRLVAYELVDSGAEGTAASLARCCKSFGEPVSDELWDAQERLTPLLKCLPEDTWKDSGKFVSRPITFSPSAVIHQTWKTFKRTPTKAEWAGFRKYALKMRNLQLDASEDPEISDLLLVQQSHATNDLWLPRLRFFRCDRVTEQLIPLIPFFLSPRTTGISIGFNERTPTAVVGPIITRLPTLCPDMSQISLDPLPSNPVITEAVSGMLLACKKDQLRAFLVNSPLTEEAREVVCQLPKLSRLHTVIKGDTRMPPVRLPNLATIWIMFDDCLDWLEGFRGANLAKLETVRLFSGSEGIGDLLGAFGRVAVTTSAQHSLSTLVFYTPHPWYPNYQSLLPFTQLQELSIEFSCDGICSAAVDDDEFVELVRAMPKLKILELGGPPCNVYTGITGKGLLALAHNCWDLWRLRIHFRVDCFAEAVEIQKTLSYFRDRTAWKRVHALTDLEVGMTPIWDWAKGTMVAEGMLELFPRLWNIKSVVLRWAKIQQDIRSFQLTSELDHQTSKACLQPFSSITVAD